MESKFSLIPNVIDTPIRQLLMTATCNQKIKVSIENLLSLSVNYAVWGNNKEQEMRKVDIRVTCNSRPGKMVFKALKETLEDNQHKKALVYASSQTKIDRFQEWCKMRLDIECDYTNKLDKVDVLKITGPPTVMEKAHHL